MRVYVNATPIDAPDGGTALDAVRLYDPVAADGLLTGARSLQDSRGLPTSPDTPLHGGAIFRVVASRRTSAPER